MKAPDLFALDEIDGHSSALTEDVPTEQEAQAAAVRSCPERAISVSRTTGRAGLAGPGRRSPFGAQPNPELRSSPLRSGGGRHT
ncbi:MAG: hypothetical protein ABIS86_20340 [Streptosporangiaceae bacterium]